ncbi:unnamed protein product [Ilex paraguariensis]|uniref:F-box associated beta-propeller type 1 domain-containing protein n=1 Tax=Ilex paraguariensis TaxID=185542 RepID=A0ABC8USI3_9AQUA
MAVPLYQAEPLGPVHHPFHTNSAIKDGVESKISNCLFNRLYMGWGSSVESTMALFKVKGPLSDCVPLRQFTFLQQRYCFLIRKSSVKRQSVCKSWYDLLTDPDFILMQFHYSNVYTPKLLGVSIDFDDPIPDIFLYSFDQVPVKIPLPFPYIPSDQVTVIVEGSCNGLVCVSLDGRSAIVLWNPATRQIRPTMVPHVDGWLNEEFDIIGFGFLPDENDYKVVKIPYPLRRQDYGGGPIPVSIYTSSSDSWKVIQAAVPDMSFRVGATSFNGFLHWMAYKHTEMELIISFDLSNEVFQQIAVPGYCGFDCNIKREIVVLKGSLAVIVYSWRDLVDRSFEVWLMTEYGVQESWTKFTIGPFSTVVWPVGIWRKDEIIFQYLHHCTYQLFLYDSSSQEIYYFPSHGAMDFFKVLNYVESLVPVNGGKKRSSRTCLSMAGMPIFFLKMLHYIYKFQHAANIMHF